MAKVLLSSDIEAMRGTIDKRVYSNSHVGPTVRGKGAPKERVETAAQQAAQNNLRMASKTYKGLSEAQAQAWAAWGKKFTRRDRVTGELYVLTGNMAFCGLTSKFLQINAGGAIPLSPPPVQFAGDTVKVTAVAGGSKITFTADKANGADIKTELLLQELAGRNRRLYMDKYVSEGFFAFATGSLSTVVAVPAGFYAPAYRFVNSKTGEEVGIVTLPTVQVT